MASIVRSSGGVPGKDNPLINEIWSANGFSSCNGDAYMNGLYPISIERRIRNGKHCTSFRCGGGF